MNYDGAMSVPFLILLFQAFSFWVITFVLHRFRHRLTLIPLYGWIAALVVMTHTLSSFGLGIVEFDLFFLLASTIYFPPIIIAILLLYLFDGVKAARKALEIILLASALQVVAVLFSSFEDIQTSWISTDLSSFITYFWSVTAMFIDIIFIAVGWELFSRVKAVPTMAKTMALTWLVFMVDTLIFVVGVFATSPLFLSILQGDLVIRSVLALVMGFFIGRYLKLEQYSEEKRSKPQNIWEIVHFTSSLETEVADLQKEVELRKDLERKLRYAQEGYQLALTGTSAGIWDWNVQTGKEVWSDTFFSLLGYEPGEIPASYEQFVKLLHPDDVAKTEALVKAHFEQKEPFVTEYRLKKKDGWPLDLLPTCKLFF